MCHTISMKVKIKLVHPDAKIPQYATSGSSGFDLVALESYTVCAGDTVLVKTGLAVSIPEDFELQIRPRSGVSLRTNLRVANAPGSVDSDYRGEICVIITNIGSSCHDTFGNGCGCASDNDTVINRGEKIAQAVVCPIVLAEFEEVHELDDTVRGGNGFGSTGK